ncbi:HpcH/HpaI aldolase family protein [Wenxinia marina]|uniref:2,4-dihydroxyhept-2-ene-1,7-dioic acid aldolase n=1 Tax=Wenxinia marina DSM 24838 TaxID=1123501 RepID=A0A0D0NNF9_9RHOB|nr:HpcH/HpaI aldolase/citrate lyase family protein [Wenxinia marina]KIQ69775.1 2,4-dihydroxyhept-2-ene-1,7-dioic acid aldolase [Wenxinia marina DSM 24838]GGL61082.1 2,4-dihydroxyhept-2-ene-1,7-dioic acid aldolase [Wenxinia marina]
MDLPRNALKAALLAGRQQIGLWSTINDVTTAEMYAGAGYDWILFDTEHSAVDTLTVLSLLQAAAPYPVSTVVRPTSLDVAEIKRLLDFGAQSLLIPYVQTVGEAELAAAAVDYPTRGIRGVAANTRANRYGQVADYVARAREEILLMVQIETVQALDVLEDIAAVPGIDALFIGPADLAASMGYPGQPSHPEVRRTCAEAMRRIRAAGKPAGYLSADQDAVAEMVEAGSLFTGVDIDSAILGRGVRDRLAGWRTRLG